MCSIVRAGELDSIFTRLQVSLPWPSKRQMLAKGIPHFKGSPGRRSTRKSTGLDGFVSRHHLAKWTPSVENDPEVGRVADEMRGRKGKVV